MRDDERYPVVVAPQDFENAPEVVPSDGADPFGRDKLSPNEVEVESGLPPKYASPVYGQGEAPPVSRKERICGLRRKTFFIAIAVAAVVIIGAIVGGAVGGVLANKSNEKSPSPTPTGALSESDRNVAASTSSSSKDGHIQLFYQDLGTTDILYRLLWKDASESEQRLSLSIPPNQGTPLAVTANKPLNGNPVIANLFYVSTDNSSSLPLIVQASLECQAHSATCDTKSNVVISTNITNGIDPKTGLAAVLLEGKTSIRLYYQAAGEHIWVLNGDNAATSGWTTVHIDGPAVPGSSITAFAKGNASDPINVMCVWNATSRLRQFEYTDIIGAEGGKTVDDSPGSGWQTSAKLAAVHPPALQSSRLYYVAPSSRDIIAYWKDKADAVWTSRRDDRWKKATGGLAAVAWRDQVRLLYFSEGRWAMSAQSNNVWADVQYL